MSKGAAFRPDASPAIAERVRQGRQLGVERRWNSRLVRAKAVRYLRVGKRRLVAIVPTTLVLALLAGCTSAPAPPPATTIVRQPLAVASPVDPWVRYAACVANVRNDIRLQLAVQPSPEKAQARAERVCQAIRPCPSP